MPPCDCAWAASVPHDKPVGSAIRVHSRGLTSWLKMQRASSAQVPLPQVAPLISAAPTLPVHTDSIITDLSLDTFNALAVDPGPTDVSHDDPTSQAESASTAIMDALNHLVAPRAKTTSSASTAPPSSIVNKDRVRELLHAARMKWNHPTLPRPKKLWVSRARPEKSLKAAMEILTLVEQELEGVKEALHVPDGFFDDPEKDTLAFVQVLEEARKVSDRAEATVIKVVHPDLTVVAFKNELLERLRLYQSNLTVFNMFVVDAARAANVDLDAHKARANAQREEEVEAANVARDEAIGVFPDDQRIWAMTTVAQIGLIHALGLYVLAGVSQVIANAFISLFALGVRLAMATGPGALHWEGGEMPELTAPQAHVYNQIPQNLQKALELLPLNSKTTVHATCPQCHKTFSPKYKGRATLPEYPSTCDNIIVSDAENTTCGTALLRIRSGKLVPIRPYATASIADYLAREMLNPEVENYCDQSCDDAFNAAQAPPPTEDAPVDTPFQAAFLRHLVGPEGDHLFVERREGKARVVLGIHTDWFNPNGNKQRGASESIGVISIVNLALPPHLRNKREHMLVCAIIPGPKEPPLDSISHYLRPIIDEALRGWSSGFTIPTASSPARKVNIVMAISINDLPAARKVAGLASYGSYFYCSTCTNVDRDTMYDTSYELQTEAHINTMKTQAYKWRDCLEAKKRRKIFEKHGVRWSEFWRLPYWNPSEMLVVDPMHAGLEGGVHYFSRHVLQLDANISLNEELSCYTFPWPEYDPDTCPPYLRISAPAHLKVFAEGMPRWLEAPLQGEGAIPREVMEKRIASGTALPVLRYYAWALNLSHLRFINKIQTTPYDNWDQIGKDTTTKATYITALMDWRLTKPLSIQQHTPTAGEWYTNPATLAFVLLVIKLATVPTHINTVPKNFGFASAGSMKADEWRILSTIYIPLALCILWNDIDGHSPPANHGPLRWLDTSMALFQAITLMCRYSTSVSVADRIRNHLVHWTNSLHDVFPHTRDHPLRPNRHVILHIPDFLNFFGPIMFWWAFPFERLIGQLQTVNTNNIIGGALEMTLLHSYLRSANFRRWLAMPTCPPIVSLIHRVLQKAFWHTKYQERADEFQFKPKELAHYPVDGTSFARAAHHVGNSIILYRKPHADGVVFAGSIQKIELEGDSRFCYITEHEPLPPGLHDPFARYPDFPAVTYSSRVVPGLAKIEINNIITHATRFEFSHNRAAILSLSRVPVEHWK